MKLSRPVLFFFLACFPIALAGAHPAGKATIVPLPAPSPDTANPESLPIVRQIKLDIQEPSDICFAPDGQHLFIVSDRGRLYKTDLEGREVDRAKYRGADFEGVCVLNDKVFVVDETLRMILEFDADDLGFNGSRQYIYTGAMNRGWESIVYNPLSERFLTFTEKLPVLRFEFDDDLDSKGVHQVQGVREVAGATWHDGRIWLVSDEDRQVYAMDPESYKVTGAWRIPVLNPEGLAFSPEGQLWVISDDLHRIYLFNLPQ